MAGRLARAQGEMARAGIDALLLTTEPEVRWFTGFLSRFWLSPTRPWFVVVPAQGMPVAVIPTIGADAMARTWITDIRTWASPRPADEGVSLLAAAIGEALAGTASRLGLPMGPESHVRMPLADLERLRAALPGVDWVDATPAMRTLRGRKSAWEIDRIARACAIAADAFDRVPAMARPGMTEAALFRAFKIACLERGADDVDYLVGGAGLG